VCKDPSEGCADKYDPYRLPPRQPDKVSLPFARPDQPMEMPKRPYTPTPQTEDLPVDPATIYDYLRDG